MRKHRFTVIEYSSFFAVRDTFTGDEQSMGDGVDTIFSPKTDKALSPGTESFRQKWQKLLNEDPDETLAAYFPSQYTKEQC